MMCDLMEYLPPKPEQPLIPPVLEYARPRQKPRPVTSMAVRVAGLIFALLSILLGAICGFVAVMMLWSSVEEKNAHESGLLRSDGLRVLAVSLILLTAGELGRHAAMRFRRQ